MSEAVWRIDDLAREAGVTVDKIRYYAREGLLPPPERSGRHALYGPRHRERLDRIRALQERRFSLAAIRALLTSDRPGLDGLFAEGDRGYTFDELVERSGVEAGLVRSLQEVDLLVAPASIGREVFDERDLELLRAVEELHAIGMTNEILVELAGIYVRHFASLQAEVHAMLAGDTRPDWDRDELTEIQKRLTSNAGRMIPAADRVLNYVHQRTLQRLTLEAIRNAAETGLGVGGVVVDDDGV